ncbi:MAG: PD40 domain-containing protein [Chloroflexi bacterium]|uniref:PD40 domain-containing protein n=1 Tax=Candidatus Chlorohelix allophototropha TaxID=3003348 RepID=A0A8T7M4X0_9CHLR|nr:PD40 domain-containing protein [Chloroflexota bacterium]WJW69067.1 zinc-ribbon domain-containing protein [Chloroflexota bacterium L227-S17]
MLICSTCHNTIPQNDRFCSYCGTTLALNNGGGSSTTQPKSGGALITVAMLLSVVVVVLGGVVIYLISQGNKSDSIDNNIYSFPTHTTTAAAVAAKIVATTESNLSIATTVAATTASAKTASATTAVASPTETPSPRIVDRSVTQRGWLLLTYTQGNGLPGIKKVNLSNRTEEIAIPAGANVSQGFWIPGQNNFVYVTEADKGINVINGSSSSRIATGLNPNVSSDGRMVYIGDDGELYLLDMRGRSSKLTQDRLGKLGPTFSPDGSKIAYSSYTNGLWQIWILNLNGGSQYQVTRLSDNARFPVWSPDGQKLAFNTTSRSDVYTPKDIYVTDLSGNVYNIVSGGQNGRPFWVEDYIFFNSDRDKTSGESDIYAVHPDGSGRDRITSSSNDFDYYYPVWRNDLP